MTAERYRAMTAPLRRIPWCCPFIRIANRVTTLAVYAAYPLFLLWVLMTEPRLLVQSVCVPLVGFVGLTFVRDRINAPRPYECLDIDPIIHKDTKGHSFPSRHVFSVFVIAATVSRLLPVIGAILYTVGVLICILRVIGGVHFPRDVIAGAVSGIAVGLLGCLLVSHFI